MIKKGSFVQFDIEFLGENYWDSLEAYEDYILENHDTIFRVLDVTEHNEIIIDDKLLRNTFFYDTELIVVTV